MEIRINLLPDYIKEQIAKTNRLHLVIRLGLFIIFIFSLFYLFLFTLSRILDIERHSVILLQKTSENISQLNKIKELDEKFEEINSSSSQALALEKDQLYWSNLFITLSHNSLDGIMITDLATRDLDIILAGKADNRDVLMNYKEKLSQEKCFLEVNLPLSNLVSKDNISFQMDLKINRECLVSGRKEN